MQLTYQLFGRKMENKALSVDNQGGVVLSRKMLSNLSQTWSLEAAMSANEVEYVGNPCTGAFPDGKCTLCTGDCDRDSDCADGLRCAIVLRWAK